MLIQLYRYKQLQNNTPSGTLIFPLLCFDRFATHPNFFLSYTWATFAQFKIFAFYAVI